MIGIASFSLPYLKDMPMKPLLIRAWSLPVLLPSPKAASWRPSSLALARSSSVLGSTTV